MKKYVLLLPIAFLAACGKSAADDKSSAPPPPAHVVVTSVIQRDQPVYREWIGTTQGDVNADIRPKVDGYLLRRAYQEGSYVQRGQLLFEIDTRQAQAQLRQAEANLEQARAGLAKSEHDVQRYEPLAAEKALSQQELDNARSARAAAQATVGALQAAVEQARLNVAWTRVTSPISGIAGLATQQVGDLVSPQTILTTVSTVDPIRVAYQVSEQEYLQFQSDPAMRNAELELVLADGSVFPHKGHIALSGRDVDVKTGTITTIGLFPNPGNVLRPGQYAKVRAVTNVRHNALLVPQRAVNELQGIEQVGVVNADNTVTVRTVKAGERVGSDWIIEEGLAPGEHVIVEGFSRVKSGAKVVPQDAATVADTTSRSTSAAK
ncbi:MAG: efflux RND transporter periplasmic adaptor subunit [Acidobacteria bacterium]|nr:efflux RND transporter periplasmic adaptor subunit [Acidobacteriota bacterium]MBV9478513.1 efflux RND transporter periplasmic adaptor subunit [Acidobacteriota bacterium]